MTVEFRARLSQIMANSFLLVLGAILLYLSITQLSHQPFTASDVAYGKQINYQV